MPAAIALWLSMLAVPIAVNGIVAVVVAAAHTSAVSWAAYLPIVAAGRQLTTSGSRWVDEVGMTSRWTAIGGCKGER